ncbi:MAG: hypothetical protein C0198_05605 [Sulfurihydrogenibium sp.]|nr:MAG: hypothetical protein C0198_05605 [Sulfurihydrogenibium sp.]
MEEKQPTLDLAIRDLFKEIPQGFLKALTNKQATKFITISLTDVDIRPDFVVELEDTNILHVEFQSFNDQSMPFRMLIYKALLKSKFKDKTISQVVLYIGEEKLRMANSIEDDGLKFWYKLVDVRDIPCQYLMESENLADKILACLCDVKDPRNYLIRIFTELLKLPDHDRKRYEKLLKSLLKKRKLLIQTFIKLQEESAMPISFTWEEIVSDPFFKKGLEEGKLEEAREALLEDIETKYDKIPEGIKDKVEKINDIQKLKELRKSVIKSNSLDEVIDLFKNI